MLLTEGGGSDVGPSKLLLSPVSSDIKEGVDTAILLIEGSGSDVGTSKLILHQLALISQTVLVHTQSEQETIRMQKLIKKRSSNQLLHLEHPKSLNFPGLSLKI